MPKLISQLELDKCPHCNVDKPNLFEAAHFATSNNSGSLTRFWKVYQCIRCGGAITASSLTEGGESIEIFPQLKQVDEAIPEPAKSYLQQALDSQHAPAGAMMLAASSIDAMLKNKSYKEGTLYSRINKAAENHLITSEMAKWAHNVRLDANEPRHADENASLPSADDARRSIEFAIALGEFLFVLPSRVNRGLRDSETAKDAGSKSE
ncbi:MAG: DUF4145 domain-containing protein [Chloroflexota bacterium]